MKKLVTIFAIAVLIPSLALGYLAMRAQRDQEIVIHSQRAILHQTATQSLASDLNIFMDDVRVYFARLVDDLVKEQGAEELSKNFNEVIQNRWGQVSVGCVVTDLGVICSPALNTTDPAAQHFLISNGLFLSNQVQAEVYNAPQPVGNFIAIEEVEPTPISSSGEPKLEARSAGKKSKFEPSRNQSQTVVAVPQSKLRSTQHGRIDYTSVNQKAQIDKIQQQRSKSQLQASKEKSAPMKAAAADQAAPEPAVKARVVAPYAQIGNSAGNNFQRLSKAATIVLGNSANVSSWSALTVANAPVIEIMGDKPEGAIARFLQDGLHVLLWVKNPAAPGKVFWAELDLSKIRTRLAEIVTGAAFFQENANEVSLALLDAQGDVVAQTVSDFTTDWRHPFVASEVGEILPRWEVAAYLIDPEAVTKSAATARWTLWLLIPILLAAITFGSLLIFRDITREMFLARQKTDFVSNVSHELKTPLTSIRMFSDLLKNSESIETDKRREYSSIISRESARLTRLINNLLDFSQMDRGNQKFNFEPLDAVALARETTENYRLQIESDGCELNFKNLNGAEIWIEGDRDALSQVLLNLLSNADKYACEGGEITVEIATPNPGEVEWRVLDRGPGIHRKHAAKIFEKFYRADDSLATGIQGSGLGLTLAKQIAHGHGGDIRFHNRDGGGSCFIVSLPVTTNQPS